MANGSQAAITLRELGGPFVRRPLDLLDPKLGGAFALVGIPRDGAAWVATGRNSAIPLGPVPGSIRDSEVEAALVLHFPEQRAYVGEPVPLGAVLHLPVVLVDKVHERRYFALSTDWAGGEDHEWRVARSLVEAVAWECLRDLEFVLWEDRPSLLATRSGDEIVRTAGRKLISAAVAPANLNGATDLFEVCSAVATMPYERKAPSGSLLIANSEHEAIERVVSFNPAIPTESRSLVRKLLETATGPLSLLTDGTEFLGLGRVVDEGRIDDESVFQLVIHGQGLWSLGYLGHQLMRVEYGLPQLPQLPETPGHAARIDRAFPALREDVSQADHLLSLLQAIGDLDHGTSVVISDHAAQEAEALGDQAVLVKRFAVEAETLGSISMIDGAILLDHAGTCHAFGVVLDGRAVRGVGKRARGSRYNSAIRYLGKHREDHGDGCLIVVASEDGMIEVMDTSILDV